MLTWGTRGARDALINECIRAAWATNVAFENPAAWRPRPVVLFFTIAKNGPNRGCRAMVI